MAPMQVAILMAFAVVGLAGAELAGLRGAGEDPKQEAAPAAAAEAPLPPPVSATLAGGSECVSRSALKCVNDYSSYWPKCSPDQAKNNAGPAGYEFGYYCDEEWAAALNALLADPVVDKCTDQEAIRKFLAQVAYETGYYSTVYQPRDGGAGLIHMIPQNWAVNARDMDALWPGNGYEEKAASMGKDFFQTSSYGWRSVAAWFKRTNRVIPGCGEDLFDAAYTRQTKCILDGVVDRSEAYNVVGRCLAEFPAGGDPTPPEPATTTTALTPEPATTTTALTTKAPTTTAPGGRACVHNTDCSESPWCTQTGYEAYCEAHGKHNPPSCPSPHCKWAS